MRYLFIAIILTITTAVSAMAQDTRYLSFKQEHVAYTPSGYYISDVVDERENKDAVGSVDRSDMAFKSPFAGALNTFISNDVSQNKSTTAISLHIQKLDVSLKKSGAAYNVNATTSFAFYVGDQRLAQFNGSAHGQTDKDPYAYTEQFIRHSLETDLKRFGEWWAQNKGSVVTKNTIKVNVTMGKTIDLPNCIIYSLSRPLSIADFMGTPEGNGTELAITASGAGMSYQAEVNNGETIVNVVITPYFEKSASWFKEAGKTPYVLAHEQAHFDISAISTCKFIAAVRSAAFTPDNYVQKLKELDEENHKRISAMQNAYDGETEHGIIQDKQLIWQEKVKAEVRSVGCY